MIRFSFTWTGDVLLNKRTAYQAAAHNEIGPSKRRNAPRSRHTTTAHLRTIWKSIVSK